MCRSGVENCDWAQVLNYVVFDWEEGNDEPPIPPSWDEEGEHQDAIEKHDIWEF